MDQRGAEAESLGDRSYVSTAQVAQALGVSVTTVKRWVDDRVLPAHRTAGGHRKLLVSDVMRLVRDGNLPHADLSRLVPNTRLRTADPAETERQLLLAIQEDDSEMMRTIVLGAYQGGLGIETLADRVLSPVMRYIGREWEAGRLSVAKEHRLSQNLLAVLYELRAHLRTNAEADQPVAIGGAPEHDHASLPSLLAKLTLLDAGWDAINLGPHTPAFAFRTAIDDLRPAMVWVSVTHLQDPERFVAEFNALSEYADERQVAVTVGGRGLTQGIRERLRYTAYGDGFTQLLAFAKTLHRRRSQPKRGRPPATAE